MAEKGDPAVLRLVVVFLRFFADMTQEAFGEASGLTQAQVSLYESGKEAPPERTLRRMAKTAGATWPLVVHLRRFFETFLSAAARRGIAVSNAGSTLLVQAVLENLLLAAAPFLVADAQTERPVAAEALREAEEIWTALEGYPDDERRRLIEMAPWACRSWAAMVQKICEASERAAAHDTEEALKLANLALFIAQGIPDEEGAKARAFGWGYLANARRVANDFDGADEAFVQAWIFWPEGVEAESGLLPEWRLLDLEASLRRAQHRFPEALERLSRAKARSGGDRLAAGRILMKKSNVLEQTGDSEGALRVLEEAEPLIQELDDPHLLFTLRFNKTGNLARLERFKEATRVLPEVWRLAAGQPNGLTLNRVAWLEAKVGAGLDRRNEAIHLLEKVRDEFAARELPYDAALAALDLAELYLREGRTAEVKEIARGIVSIFQMQKVHREALAAVLMFLEAADQERATVELARRLADYLRRAEGHPELKFDAP